MSFLPCISSPPAACHRNKQKLYID
jgi:hypothetical protein